jgi:hypothetical protein
MKKSAKPFKHCSGTRLKRAGTLEGTKNAPGKNKQKIENREKERKPPSAPHNTTEFLISQKTEVLYDPTELLGEMLGLTHKDVGLKMECWLN